MSRSRKSTGGDDMPGGVPRDVDDDHPSPAKPAAKRVATNEGASKTSTSRPPQQQPASPSKGRDAHQEKAAAKPETKPQPKRETEPEHSADEAEKEEEDGEKDQEQDDQPAQESGEAAPPTEDVAEDAEKDAGKSKDAVAEKKDTKTDGKKDVPDAKPKDAAAEKEKDIAAGKSKDAVADKKDTETDGKKGAPEAKHKDAATEKRKDSPEAKSKDAPEAKPKDVTAEKPKDSPEAKSKDAPEAKPEDVTAEKPKDSPETKPKDAVAEKKNTETDGKKDAPEAKPKDAAVEKEKDIAAAKPKDVTAEKPKDAAENKPKDAAVERKKDTAEDAAGAAKEKGDPDAGATPVKEETIREEDGPRLETKDENAQRDAEIERVNKLGSTLGKYKTGPIAFPLEGDVTDAKAALDTFSLDLSRILIGLTRKPAAAPEVDAMQKNQRIRDYNAAVRDRRATRLLPIYNQKNELQEGLYRPNKAGPGTHTIDTLWKLSEDMKKQALLTIRDLEKIPDDEKKTILTSLGMTGPYAFVSDDDSDPTDPPAARTIQLRIAMGLPATYSASG